MKRFLIAITGVLMLAAGVFLLIKQNNLSKVCTAETTATVVDFKQEFDSDSESSSIYTYYPIVEFQAGGQPVRATLDRGSAEPAYDVDAKIDILYNPADPQQVIVKGDASPNIMGVAISVLGGLVTVYGLYAAFKPVPEKKENHAE